MKNLETIKTKSQAGMTHLVELGQQSSPEMKTWGVTAATAAAGGIALAVTAKGVLAIVGILAAPPVALTVGALGGGVLGWRYLQRQSPALTTSQPAVAPVFTPLATGEPLVVPPVEEPAPVEQIAPALDPVQSSEATRLDAVPLDALSVEAPPLADPVAAVPPMPETAEPVVPVAEPAHLEVINGIGAGYAKRLHEAGIHTFADLAQQTPEQLRTIIHVDKWVTDEELHSWIEQARVLAGSSGENH